MITNIVIVLVFLAVARLAAVRIARLRPGILERHRAMKDYYHKWRQLFDQNLHSNVNRVQWRFRWHWVADYFEIWVKPTLGQYPNLPDHKYNLAYDMERIQSELENEPFRHGEPYSRGDWVRIPFRKQEAS